MLSITTQNMGLLCSKRHRYNEADTEENAQAAEIERRIEQETKVEQHIQKILLLGKCNSTLFLIALIIWLSNLFCIMLIVRHLKLYP